MLTKPQRVRINKELKSVMSQFENAYKMSSEESRLAFMKTLSPGSAIPKEGVIYGDTAQNEFKSMCLGYKGKVDEILGGVVKDLKTKITEAPSTEAVNTISLLKFRGDKDISHEEIQDIIDRYGDNVQAYKAIVSIANEKGVLGFDPGHPDEVELSDIENLSGAISRALSAERVGSKSGSIGFYIESVNTQIDDVFPTDGE